MRNLTIVTKNLLIINVLAFIATWVVKGVGIDLQSMCGLHFFLANDFHVYQLVTYMFLHANFAHILFNMFALWMFGCVIESVWGPKKFLFYYISCGIGAGLMQELAQFVSFYVTISGQDPSVGLSDVFQVGQALSMQLNSWTTIGASGAVYAILLAFGMIFPNERIFIFPLPIPIKAKWFVTFYVCIELFSALGSPGDGVAHMAHLGGMLFGFFMIRYWNLHPTSGYGRSSGLDFFENLKRNLDKRNRPRGSSGRDMHVERGGAKESDWEYNARKKANQDEVDRILDKIRKSGYDSLTKEEKQKLFDSSNND
ncbi:rhomboid family intramembrane serine protease [Xylanibacter rodentium]|jgi:membrane associated rhomboid family serine protease|uniref:Rhomboid family intramembrane serine protease n=1 Tax=Xylanibacter rodentium TaxID=2736289 RepID=A0ABX2AVP9_9BACT|nr:rhomboid family intramembrane serine protease [Xylanibacter rodentium]NPE12135.1 rhomboid family intramembrane serine protease [Prevotella sp. PJ1A]NPE14651.1 rhomboid family intramembrane serine protease [Xylanibacter rodentium]NPE39323.1 rhomboid family intramembrane serine protease [Prevotella sp. PCJ2]